jgi:hypothetical protein
MEPEKAQRREEWWQPELYSVGKSRGGVKPIPADEVIVDGGEEVVEQPGLRTHQWMVMACLVVTRGGLAMVTSNPTADAPAAASCGSRAGQVRSPRGAAKCEECIGMVSLSGERAEQLLQQRRHSCTRAVHGCA